MFRSMISLSLLTGAVALAMTGTDAEARMGRCCCRGGGGGYGFRSMQGNGYGYRSTQGYGYGTAQCNSCNGGYQAGWNNGTGTQYAPPANSTQTPAPPTDNAPAPVNNAPPADSAPAPRT